MVELLRFLEANGFVTYIASGGDRDFMRPIAGDLYGIPPERVIGSSLAIDYRESAEDDSRTCCTRARWSSSTTARPSRCASGAGSVAGRCSPAATPTATCRCCASPRRVDRPALRTLLLHDDAEREFDYTAGAEKALERAAAAGWTVISIKDDWSTVFAD